MVSEMSWFMQVIVGFFELESKSATDGLNITGSLPLILTIEPFAGMLVNFSVYDCAMRAAKTTQVVTVRLIQMPCLVHLERSLHRFNGALLTHRSCLMEPRSLTA